MCQGYEQERRFFQNHQDDKPPNGQASAPMAGYGAADCDISKGVWFKSSVTGMLYRNHGAAGDIECVIIDGVWYDRSKAP